MMADTIVRNQYKSSIGPACLEAAVGKSCSCARMGTMSACMPRLPPIPLFLFLFVVAHQEIEKPSQRENCDAGGDLEYIYNGQCVSALCRVVMKAEQQHIVHRASNLV